MRYSIQWHRCSISMHEIHGYREAGRQAIGRVWQLLENTSQVRARQHVNVTMAVAAHLGAAGACIR
ncbi:hypothetical protein BDI4_580021 [Burkholderia diffusa]|nr:hypothetical protein BDI4_580021 [Burkholderia diffusa]